MASTRIYELIEPALIDTSAMNTSIEKGNDRVNTSIDTLERFVGEIKQIIDNARANAV